MLTTETQKNSQTYQHIVDHLSEPSCILETSTHTLLSCNKPFISWSDALRKSGKQSIRVQKPQFIPILREILVSEWKKDTHIEIDCETGDTLSDIISATQLTDETVLLTISDSIKRKKEEIAQIQHNLSISLAASSSVDTALKLCYDAAIAVSGMECGGIYLHEKETGDFVLRYSDNFSDKFVHAVARSPENANNIRLIKKGQALYTCYEEIKSSMNRAAYEEGLRAIGLIPLLHQGKLIGSLNIASRAVDTIPQYSRNELETIASQVGNVIARIQAEDEIAQSRKDMQAFFDSIHDFIFVLSADGQIIQTNTEVSDRLGYTDDELLQMNVLEVHPPERRAEALSIVNDMIAGKRDFCPIPLYRKDGTCIPVETKVTPGHWRGQPVLFGLSRDITERERAKAMLERRDSILSAVSTTAHMFLTSSQWDEHISDVLARLGHATGVNRVYIYQNYTDPNGVLCCAQHSEWCAPGIRPMTENPDHKNVGYIQGGFTRWMEMMPEGQIIAGTIDSFPPCEQDRFRRKGVVSLIAVPVISNKQWWGFIGFEERTEERDWSPQEIDALRVAADILGSAIYRTMIEEVFRRPVEQSLVGTYLIYDDTFRYVNPRFAEIFGYETSELINIENIESLIHPEDGTLFRTMVDKRLSGVVPFVHYEFRGRTKTGNTIYCEAFGSSIEYYGKPAIVGNIMDITRRKIYETELEESLKEKIIHLNEIHHRVKNNLQIISAFTELQMMTMDESADTHNLYATKNLIQTLALIHENLYQSHNFNRISMEVQIRALVSNFTFGDKKPIHTRYDLDLEHSTIDINAAIPFSLAITEFLNYSQVYLSHPDNKRIISIQLHHTDESPITCIITDNGISSRDFTTFSESQIIELQLIHSLITKQLKGTVDLKVKDDIELTITFPVKDVVVPI